MDTLTLIRLTGMRKDRFCEQAPLSLHTYKPYKFVGNKTSSLETKNCRGEPLPLYPGDMEARGKVNIVIFSGQCYYYYFQYHHFDELHLYTF